ncbi:MAG: hypothetical protein ACKORL_00710 [Phycisphaerales bacterium]
MRADFGMPAACCMAASTASSKVSWSSEGTQSWAKRAQSDSRFRSSRKACIAAMRRVASSEAWCAAWSTASSASRSASSFASPGSCGHTVPCGRATAGSRPAASSPGVGGSSGRGLGFGGVAGTSVGWPAGTGAPKACVPPPAGASCAGAGAWLAARTAIAVARAGCIAG